MAENKFDRFKFKPFINKAIEELRFHEPTEIQEKMMPLILKGESAIGQSQTGTGKHMHIYCQCLKQLILITGSTRSYYCANKRTCKSNLSRNIKNYEA